MRCTIKKWGNSAAVRIPSSLMKSVEIDIDQMVDLHGEDGRIVIEPIRFGEYNLQELLSRITPDNLPDAVDTGLPVGKEIW